MLPAALALALATPPTARRAAPAGPRLRILGPAQMVFNWSTQACTPTEEPDLPVRAFRDYRGEIQLLLSHYVNFRMIGASLSTLQPECRPVLSSPERSSPRRFEDREWLASLFTSDGRTIWALVHEEYQGNIHRGRCPSGSYYRCWYNSITLARSSDGGRTYVHMKSPRQLVAAPSRPYRQAPGPVGVFTPSNIVTGPDGADYALVRIRDPNGTRGACLLRTRRVGSPTAWRAWTGSGFGGEFTNPYRSPPSGAVDCTPIAPGDIAEMTESLTYNYALGRYLLVGLAPPGPLSVGAKVTGIYFSTSPDLVHWSPRTLVKAAVAAQTYTCGGPSPIAYPSVLDPRSTSRTYATSGGTAFLYFTQFRYSRCRQVADRDLLRVPIEISP
ncbi:MAG TPA: hypothetical protein VG366_00250 [Solirubrobacteraceae bacterium]|nr:hypothetical protein [Solirubrobacteraceae bacterium]